MIAPSTADVHLPGIDCGDGALNALTRPPHRGAVVTRAPTERAVRLMARLEAELTRRQDLLVDKGCADIGEQRSSSDRPSGFRTSSSSSTAGSRCRRSAGTTAGS